MRLKEQSTRPAPPAKKVDIEKMAGVKKRKTKEELDVLDVDGDMGDIIDDYGARYVQHKDLSKELDDVKKTVGEFAAYTFSTRTKSDDFSNFQMNGCHFAAQFIVVNKTAHLGDDVLKKLVAKYGVDVVAKLTERAASDIVVNTEYLLSPEVRQVIEGALAVAVRAGALPADAAAKLFSIPKKTVPDLVPLLAEMAQSSEDLVDLMTDFKVQTQVKFGGALG